MQLGERRCYVQALVLSHSAEWQDVGSNCNSAPRYKENCVCVPPNVRGSPIAPSSITVAPGDSCNTFVSGVLMS